jgi:hypothetical protein
MFGFPVCLKNKMGKSAAGSSMHHVPPPMPAPPPALASAVPYSGFQPSYPPASAYPAASAYTAYPTPSPSAYKSPDAPSPQQPRPALGYTTTSYPPQPYEKAYPPQPYGQVYPPSPQPYGQPHPPPSATQSPYPPGKIKLSKDKSINLMMLVIALTRSLFASINLMQRLTLELINQDLIDIAGQ